MGTQNTSKVLPRCKKLAGGLPTLGPHPAAPTLHLRAARLACLGPPGLCPAAPLFSLSPTGWRRESLGTQPSRYCPVPTAPDTSPFLPTKPPGVPLPSERLAHPASKYLNANYVPGTFLSTGHPGAELSRQKSLTYISVRELHPTWDSFPELGVPQATSVCFPGPKAQRGGVWHAVSAQ